MTSGQQKTENRKNKSFTLVEVLVYIATLVIVVTVISSFIIWSVMANTKNKVMAETLDNTRRAIEIMTHEIKEADDVYEPTSVFNSHPGQLSLETRKYLPIGEILTYIDFYICDNQLCLKKESIDGASVNPVILTSEKVEAKNLTFSKIISGDVPSVQIDLTLGYKDATGRPEYQASVNLQSV